MTTPKSGYQNAAQLEIINKLKLKQSNAVMTSATTAPLSPLALSNLKNDKGTILIKRRKNVQSSTVSTQTDASFLLDEFNNKKKHYLH